MNPLFSHVRAARLLVAPLLSLAVMAVMPQLAAATTPLAPGSEGATPRDLSLARADGQTSPRECNTASSPGRDTVDCAYDYGWNAAADSYASAVRAYVSLGWADADAERTPVANEWWLDVETGNSWRADPALNVASLQGSVDYLEYVGVVGVGFYSTGLQWGQVTGGSSAFSEYRSWVAGARSLHGAKEHCVGSGFTGGGVTMSQYRAQGFDANYRC